jgi:DUF4097 and DUF4098 domain-containing protein YvlB
MRTRKNVRHRFHGAHGPICLSLFSMFSMVSVISVLTVANAAAEGASAGKTARHATVSKYQARNRGPEQSDRVSRRIKLARNGSVSISNVSGDIVVTGGSGDEVAIEAVKRTRGSRGQLGDVSIDINEAPSRVDIHTNYAARDTNVSVDYTVTVPSSTTVEVNSVSGDIKVTGVQGSVRVESVSGGITASGTPRLEKAKSVSGDVTLSDTGGEGEIAIGSVSGNVHVKGLKSRGVDASSVSGDVTLADIACERLGAKSVSGNLEYDGTLARSGRYNLNSHSGSVKLLLANPSGFELDASTFSGSIHSDLPLTIGGDADRSRDERRHGPGNRRVHATFGDSSAVIVIRTFSGDITIQKR